MKFLKLIPAFLLLLLVGCESVSVPDRFATVPPQVIAVNGDVEEVYLAAQKAFKRLDFVVTRSVMGRVEAASAIKTSVTFGDSKQVVARVRITEAEPGKAEVELSVTEEVSSKSMGGTRQQALREHSLFQIYFATLQQVLQERAAERAVEKK